MQEMTLSSLLKQLSVETPVGLAESVLMHVREAEIRALHVRIVLSFIGLLASVGAIIFSWSSLLAELAGSSFFNFVRLGFTDGDVLFANIGSIANGMLESFPVLTVLLGLVMLFCLIAFIALLQSLRKITHLVALRHA